MWVYGFVCKGGVSGGEWVESEVGSQFTLLHSLSSFAGTAPLRRTVTIEDVGNVAAFLCSDLASGITGEITYVDAGYNILGMAELSSDT